MGLRVMCIVFPLALLAGIVYGGYLITESYQDQHSEEVLDLNPVIHSWTNQSSAIFSTLNVSVASNTTAVPLVLSLTEDWPMLAEDLEPYTGLAYTANLTFQDLDTVSERQTDWNNIELVTNLTLYINGSLFEVANLVVGQLKHYRFANTQCIEHMPTCWNAETKTCYSFWLLHTACFVVNETTPALLETDASSCSPNTREELEQPELGSCNFTDYANATFAVTVRSVHDPLVYATSHDILSLSPLASTYLLEGVLLVCVCLFLCLVPAVCVYRRTKYLPLAELELARPRAVPKTVEHA